MALHWNIVTPIQRHGRDTFYFPDDKENQYGVPGGMRPETEAVIHCTMVLGMGGFYGPIEFEEFWTRLAAYQRVHALLLDENGDKVLIKKDFVSKMDGFSTNVQHRSRIRLALELTGLDLSEHYNSRVTMQQAAAKEELEDISERLLAIKDAFKGDAVEPSLARVCKSVHTTLADLEEQIAYRLDGEPSLLDPFPDKEKF